MKKKVTKATILNTFAESKSQQTSLENCEGKQEFNKQIS